MATATGLILTKRFTYRTSADEEWSNRYWFTGPPPDTDQHWRDLANDVAELEVECYAPSSVVVSAMGYDSNDPDAHAVWKVDYALEGSTLAGRLIIADGHPFAGDQAGLVQWKCGRLSAKGKPIFLRKFFHDGGIATTARDSVDSATYTAYSNFATAMVDGSVLGARVIRSHTQDEQIVFVGAYPYVTTRTLKRRGKRPLPKA